MFSWNYFKIDSFSHSVCKMSVSPNMYLRNKRLINFCSLQFSPYSTAKCSGYRHLVVTCFRKRSKTDLIIFPFRTTALTFRARQKPNDAVTPYPREHFSKNYVVQTVSDDDDVSIDTTLSEIWPDCGTSVHFGRKHIDLLFGGFDFDISLIFSLAVVALTQKDI